MFTRPKHVISEDRCKRLVNFRIDETLCAEFDYWCTKDSRTRTSILIGLMQQYVEDRQRYSVYKLSIGRADHDRAVVPETNLGEGARA